jgi:hypothetical protein
MDSLIKISVSLAMAAVFTGNLPKVLKVVKRAQIELIQESKASKWPKVIILNPRK